MAKSVPDPIFPDNIWDGTTEKYPDITTDKTPDVEFAARYRAEIRSLEKVLDAYSSVLDVIANYGAGNTLLGVQNDGTALEYKALSAGNGILITHGSGTITIASTSVGPEDTTFGYTGDQLTTVTTSGGTKTFGYSGGQLQTISDTETQTLSTFGYTNGKLTSITVTPL